MAEERRSKPSFFKVLFNENFTLQLRLPTAFVQKHGDILHENAVLGASSGESWVVKLEHSEEYEKCYFTRGWPKFAKDLGLKMGEFLLFLLVGKSTFDVLVYGISGCERVISNCNSEFESSDSDEEVQILSKDYTFAARGNHDMSNKRAKTSILEKEVTKSPGNVDRLSPLYFEKVLKTYHRSRVSLHMKFANMSGLISQKTVVLEYVPKQHFTSAVLHLMPRLSRIEMAWSGFIKENGLVFGRTYSFEFNPRTNVIRVDEIKI
ncbi:B3 domain-containing protein REM5-like isoform X2 [Primulina huaijiensis]|uniref:B3 domain-containing protein REM5-like isoform X2 n=1 Tax=Primulina huaijiensis TaxID=1492673 RepID=UPI003CC73CE9